MAYLSSTRCTVATSCAGSNGLTIQPVAPALLAFALAVRASFGRQHQDRRVAISWLRRAARESASMPSMIGMFTSSSTRSNAVAARQASASSPSAGGSHIEARAAQRHPHHVAHRRRIVRGKDAHHVDSSGCRQSRASTPRRAGALRRAGRASRRATRPCAVARPDRERRRTAAASSRCRRARRC